MLLKGIRNRISGAVAGVIGGIMFFACGAILAFVVSPSQAVEWRRIQNLPELTASSLASTATGEDVVITGTLDGNETVVEDLVAYQREVWDVTESTDEDGNTEYEGSWDTVETNVPTLTVNISGGAVTVIAASNAIQAMGSPAMKNCPHQTRNINID